MTTTSQSRLGILYLISGPSGSGKTTLCQRMKKEGIADYAISATTRAKREGEEHGSSYYFLSVSEFKEKIAEGAFIEYAEVHGNYYGTLKSEVITKLESGTDIVMDIDVQGAELIRAVKDSLIQTCLVDLFVMPPDVAELERRLRFRDTDAEEVIALRLQNSIEEMARWSEYTYCLTSTDRDNDYSIFKSILSTERLKTSRFLPSQ